jgi:hypothetical protein
MAQIAPNTCIFCGGTGDLKTPTEKGLKSIIKASNDRGDDLHLRLDVTRFAEYSFHNRCRAPYIDRRRIAEQVAYSQQSIDAQSLPATPNTASTPVRHSTDNRSSSTVAQPTANVCLFCQGTGDLKKPTEKGMRSIIKASEDRGDNLHLRDPRKL